MTNHLRAGVTVLELCVAMTLLGFVTVLAGFQLSRARGAVAHEPTAYAEIRRARTTAMRSGRVMSGITWSARHAIEYTALPTGSILIDSSATVRSPADSATSGDDAHAP